jgi:hypothetical protein
MPSLLFNVLFLIALIVPVTMYVIGVVILMISIVVRHFNASARHAPAVEAIAH